MAPLLDGSLGLAMGAGFGLGSAATHGEDGEDPIDSDDSDAELGGDDRDFLRQLQRARARAKDTRPLVSDEQPTESSLCQLGVSLVFGVILCSCPLPLLWT